MDETETTRGRYMLRERRKKQIYTVSSSDDDEDHEFVSSPPRKKKGKISGKIYPEQDEEDPDFIEEITNDDDDNFAERETFENKEMQNQKMTSNIVRFYKQPGINSGHIIARFQNVDKSEVRSSPFYKSCAAQFLSSSKNNLNRLINILPQKSPVSSSGQQNKPTVCCVPHCLMNKKDGTLKLAGKELVIYPFPRQREVALHWIDAVQPNNPHWWPPDYYGVCAMHFSVRAKPFLGDAPSLNLPQRTVGSKIVIHPQSEQHASPVKPSGGNLPTILPASSMRKLFAVSSASSKFPIFVSKSCGTGGQGQTCVVATTSSANKIPIKVQCRPQEINSNTTASTKLAQIISGKPNASKKFSDAPPGITTVASYETVSSTLSAVARKSIPGIRIVSYNSEILNKEISVSSNGESSKTSNSEFSGKITSQSSDGRKTESILQKRNQFILPKPTPQSILIDSLAGNESQKCITATPVLIRSILAVKPTATVPTVPPPCEPQTSVDSNLVGKLKSGKARKSMPPSLSAQKRDSTLATKKCFDSTEPSGSGELTSVSRVLDNVYSSTNCDLLPGITVASDSDNDETENESESVVSIDQLSAYSPIVSSPAKTVESPRTIVMIGNKKLIVNKVQNKHCVRNQGSSVTKTFSDLDATGEELPPVLNLVENVLISTDNDVLPGITIQSDDDDYDDEQSTIDISDDNDSAFNQSTIETVITEKNTSPANNRVATVNSGTKAFLRFGPTGNVSVQTQRPTGFGNVSKSTVSETVTKVYDVEDSNQARRELPLPRVVPNSARSLSLPNPEDILGRYLYTGPSTFYCSICCLHLTGCTRTNICEHVCKHKSYKTLYDCRFCGSVFDSFKFLFCHWKRNDCWRKAPRWLCSLSGALSKCWVCFVCGMKHTQSKCSSLTHHVEIMHLELAKVFPTVVSPTFYANHPLDLTCSICSYVASSVPMLFWHVGSFHNHMCDVFQSDAEVSLKYLDEHLDFDRHRHTTPCTCKHTFNSYTPKQITSTSEVLANFLVLERYKHCPECSSDITYLHQLLSHSYTCHTLCSLCTIVTYDFWSTAAHVVFRHWLEKCPFCVTNFAGYNRQNVLSHFNIYHNINSKDLAYDVLLGFPTPLLFESSRIFYCPGCQDNGLFLYFSTQTALTTYHKFMFSKYGVTHQCQPMVGNAEYCIKKRLCDDSATCGLKIKSEPPDSETSVVLHDKEQLAKEWELQNAISVVEDEEEEQVQDGENPADDSFERREDDIIVLPNERASPIFVDLEPEEPKQISLAAQASTHCWCLPNLHKRNVEKNRFWALRLNVAEWAEPERCALCLRKSKSFMQNVYHVAGKHFKCLRHFCERCNNIGFATKRGLADHSKLCPARYTTDRQMLVLVKPLEDLPESQYPELTEIDYINSLGVYKTGNFEKNEEAGPSCNNKFDQSVACRCTHRGCSKPFSHLTDLRRHIVGEHFGKRWKNGGPCFLCGRNVGAPTELFNHLVDLHSNMFRPSVVKLKSKNASQKCLRFFEISPKKLNNNKKFKGQSPIKPSALFRCDECHVILETEETFSNHMLQMHAGCAEEFQCKLCKETLKTHEELRYHSKVAHQKYFCYNCLALFESRRECFKHTRRCVENLHNSDSQVTNDEKLKQLGMDRSEKSCASCSLTFRSSTKFRGHLRLHCCRPLAKCQKCRRVFYQFKSYLRHVTSKDSCST